MEDWFDESEEFDAGAERAEHARPDAPGELDEGEQRHLAGSAGSGKGKADAEGSGQGEDAAGFIIQEGNYPESDWEAIIEAVLFTMGDSVELGTLALAIGQCEGIAQQVVEKLTERYERENRGMRIIALENSYQMATCTRFYENLIRVASIPKKQALTEVVLETLSVIAYKQPVTKAEISRIRGVSSDHAVNRLVEYGLVCEVGRMDAPGRPVLFATTEEFLRRFGVVSANCLPMMSPEQAGEIEQEVTEELKAKGEPPESGVDGAGGGSGAEGAGSTSGDNSAAGKDIAARTESTAEKRFGKEQVAADGKNYQD